jgi:hypothetical protein
MLNSRNQLRTMGSNGSDLVYKSRAVALVPLQRHEALASGLPTEIKSVLPGNAGADLVQRPKVDIDISVATETVVASDMRFQAGHTKDHSTGLGVENYSSGIVLLKGRRSSACEESFILMK